MWVGSDPLGGPDKAQPRFQIRHPDGRLVGTEFPVGQLHLQQVQGIEFCTHFPLRVAPEHDSVLVKQSGQGLGNAGVRQSLDSFNSVATVECPRSVRR